ncbi:DinB superfamily protein [Posidoniimonas polymericola]|uniref:DinB superfamily protein n=1 Tax=Posidoniimonas polymericola TaxID=2528002 RepID=A0A5C5YLS1_9BACT|nr:DinB family protein [Posidoniimonas polymericola]TWT75874.1 DinB superfamily protein [Posidoniimonas polymericola]
MDYSDLVLPEFLRETASTRRVLERAPADKWDWSPHPKSRTIGWNANHLAEIVGWVEGTLTQTEWEINPVGGEPYQSPNHPTPAAVLAEFDANVESARAAIERVSDDEMQVTWRLLNQGQAWIEEPRANVVRTFILNHLIHHRAILTVYLRLNDIPVPGLYGPSADEPG